MQKFEKVLDLAIEALELYLGRGTDTAELEAARGETAAPKERKPRKPRTTPPPAETEAKSPFEIETTGASIGPKLSAEETLEAKRRGQEIIGLFIRRYLKAAPTGLDRAKKIINDTLGGPRAPKAAWQLEDITTEDWLKLTPIFEAELDKAAA